LTESDKPLDSYQIALTGIAILISAVLLVMLAQLISRNAPVLAPVKNRETYKD